MARPTPVIRGGAVRKGLLAVGAQRWTWLLAACLGLLAWQRFHTWRQHERHEAQLRETAALVAQLEQHAGRLASKGINFEHDSGQFNKQLDKQTRMWSAANKELAKPNYAMYLADGGAASPPPPVSPSHSSALSAARMSRAQELLKSAAHMFGHDKHAARDWAKREQARLEGEEQRLMAKASHKPHRLPRPHELPPPKPVPPVAQRPKQSSGGGPRKTKPQRAEGRVSEERGEEGFAFRSAFSERVLGERLARAKAMGKHVERSDGGVAEALLLEWDDGRGTAEGASPPSPVSAELFGDSRLGEHEGEEEEGEEEDEEEAVLAKMAGGVVEGGERWAGGAASAAAASGGEQIKGGAPSQLAAWVEQHQSADSGVDGVGVLIPEAEEGEEYSIKAEKPASPSSRLLLPPDAATNKSSTEARVVQRCLGAPSPWMPAPFRFRKIISAFHRREARKGAEEAAARKAAREAQRIPKGVTYYQVPKGQADRPEQWVAEQNAKIRNDRLVEAHGGGKAVVRGGKLVHLPDEHGSIRQASKHGRFLLSGAQSERSARLTDIPSFCAKKSTEAWKECVVEHAKSRCTAEAANEAPQRRFYTKELAACLADTQHCESTLSHLQHLTSNLRGVGALALSHPSCLLYNAGVEQDEKEAAACGALGDNSETAGYMGRCGKPGGGPAEGCSVNVADIPLPPRDIRKRWDTCAVVGHAAGLLAAKNGASIDAHDAVFRINPHSSELAAQATKVGRRTTVAVLGREATDALLEGEGGFSRAHAAKTPYIVFWHYHAAQYLRYLTEEIPVQGRSSNTTTLALMSPALINWQLEVYAKLRADLIRLGLGPLSCPRFMSSGMHAMLLATQLCRNVNLFGISVESGSAPKQGARSSSINRHSFDAETMITRLLWMAGAFDVCTA